MTDPSATRPILIRGGHVLSADRTTRIADLRIEATEISAIGENLPAEGDEHVIAAHGHLVLPGLVDAHRHLWLGSVSASSSGVTLLPYAAQVNERLGDAFTPQDVYAGVFWGALQALNAGVTTVADWAHNAGTADDIRANLQALHDSGIRARFFYGGKASSSGDQSRYAGQARALPDIHRAAGIADRVSLGLALRGPSMSTPGETAADFRLARELGLPISVHAGMAGLPGAVSQLSSQGLLGPDINYVHANQFSPQEWDLIAESGGTIAATPTVEMTMGLGVHPAAGQALARRIPVGLGADTVAYGPTDLFGEMRLALAAERSRGNAGPIGRGEMPAGLRCDHYDMIDLATRGGATVLGLPGTGELAAGKAADVITIDLGAPHLNGYGDPALSAFLGAGPRDVSTVIADGHLLKDRGRLHPGLLEHGTDRLRSSRARITARAASGDR